MKSLLLASLLAASGVASASIRTFDLTPAGAPDTYTAARGFGFEPGFAPTAEARPFLFSVAVPEGNYRVTVTFGGEAAGDTTVKAESRRLMLERVRTAPDAAVTRRFTVNVRNPTIPPPPRNAPGGTAVAINGREAGSFTWDDKLTLEFDGTPRVRAIAVEPVSVPTIFLAGDSTVTDQRWEDGASWGQMLPRFFQPDVAVANHAESGETLKSFISGLRLAKLLSEMKAGDYLFIQFGHNDEKTAWPQTYVEAHTTYRAYLRAFIAEARLRQAVPVLVTSPQRRTFDAAGHIRNTHGDYPQAVRDVAAEEHVALIDLDRMSTAFYEALGPARAPLAFGDHGKEATHHNNYGAYELARCVAQGLRDARLPLADHLTADFTPFDPAHPDDPATFALPPSPLHSDLRPRGN